MGGRFLAVFSDFSNHFKLLIEKIKSILSPMISRQSCEKDFDRPNIIVDP